MTTATEKRLMTVEEFLALPDDGVERWLINGEVREFGMTIRNWYHSSVMSQVAKIVGNWKDKSNRKGKVLSGEAGIRLPDNPNVVMGIDVGYVSQEVMAQQSGVMGTILGVPDLVVEILSPSDTNENVNEKIDTYLAAKVPMIWVIDPRRKSATVFRPDEEDVYVSEQGEMIGDPVLPGLRFKLTELFE